MSDYFNGTGTIGFTCDNCGRELLGCTWVNGMRFCAKCYQETFGNTNPFEKELRDKIADLEAKLTRTQNELSAKVEYIHELVEVKDDYKQQLADKKKEIEQLKEQRHIYLNRSVEECNKITDLEFELQHKDQDKISFAVEQLEKVKRQIIEDTVWELTCEDVLEIIDNQIKAIKGDEVV